MQWTMILQKRIASNRLHCCVKLPASEYKLMIVCCTFIRIERRSDSFTQVLPNFLHQVPHTWDGNLSFSHSWVEKVELNGEPDYWPCPHTWDGQKIFHFHMVGFPNWIESRVKYSWLGNLTIDQVPHIWDGEQIFYFPIVRWGKVG